jgi:leucyl aminopeptidase
VIIHYEDAVVEYRGGALLLGVPEDTVWVHRDLAGTSWSERDQPHQIEGATGAATRTVIALAERLAGGVQ